MTDGPSLTYERQPEATGYFSESDSLTSNSAWSRKLVYDETIDSVSYKGLLTTMCDARNVCAQSKYDQLNRPWEVSYSGAHTPTVTNYYDQAHSGYFNKGRLTEIATASMSDSDAYDGYDNSIPVTSLKYDFDAMGRVVKSSQTVDSNVHPFEYTYNLGGQMTQEKYPSGRVVNFGYDDASRLSNVNGGAGHTYVDSFTYTGPGLVSGYTLGNGATVSLSYGTNGRLQLSEIILAKNGTTLQKYQYSYGQVESGSVNTAKNNGQLAQVDSWIGTTQEYRQQYTYDSVNRLIESKEKYGTSLASTAYDIIYRYDAFGNRQQRSADNSGNSAITQKWVESGDISKTNNRYTSGVSYDAAGNITADPRFRDLLYGYDANGRQNYSAQVNGSSPVTTIFDGAGRRVATKASGYLSVMVYDAGGKLAAEYSQFTEPTTANVDFITPNHQGSTSVITDNAGAVKSRLDYLPFGEEIGNGVGSRTTAKKFSQTDNVRQKYAGMETDDATGLNHTLWRKDDNWSGRWTSPDPYGGSMSTADPQSFNRYTYCNNDPVNHVDLLGLALSDIGVYQTDNPAVAATLENEMTRRVRVLTSAGGQAYSRHQRAHAAEARGNRQQGQSGQSPQQSRDQIVNDLEKDFPPLVGADVDTVAQAAIDALDALSEYKDDPNGLYQALINAFRLSGGTTTPTDAILAIRLEGIVFDTDGNPSITQNVFDGRRSQLLVRDDDGKNVTIQKWFSNHPSSNAIEYGGSVYVGGGFFNLDRQGRAQAIIHEFVVHVAFGRKDIEFGKTRHEGSDSINNTIRRSYRQPPVPRY